MCLVLKCMQEILVCIEYFIHDTLYIFLHLIFVLLDLHTPLTYWIWISTHRPLIYNPHFFVYLPFLCMLSLFILQLKDFVLGNYWGWIYIHLLDLTRNSCEKMRLQVPGRNQTWGSGPFDSAALEPQGREFHCWTYSCIFCSCSWLGLINV